jgi:hypothetical protein
LLEQLQSEKSISNYIFNQCINDFDLKTNQDRIKRIAELSEKASKFPKINLLNCSKPVDFAKLPKAKQLEKIFVHESKSQTQKAIEILSELLMCSFSEAAAIYKKVPLGYKKLGVGVLVTGVIIYLLNENREEIKCGGKKVLKYISRLKDYLQSRLKKNGK